MDNKDKKAAGVFSLAAVLAAAMLLKKKKPGPITAAAVKIAVLDAQGNEIPHSSPVELEAGESYTVSITVTNQSTQGGVPVAVSLTTEVVALISQPLATLIEDIRTDSYLAGGSNIFTYQIVTPDFACNGAIGATVYDLPLSNPAHQQLASGQLDFNVVVAKRSCPCGDYGDVDGDGFVTENDAELIAQYVVGLITLTPQQLLRADVTGDGQVTDADALAISQYIQGIIDTFPVCMPPINYAASVDVGVE